VSAPLPTWFLRFYNQTQEQIDECVRQLRELHSSISDAVQEPLEMSADWFMQTLPGAHWEVTLSFANEAALASFVADEQARAVYKRFSARLPDGSPLQDGEVLERREGDFAFRVA
jgi:hypothetical protein